MEDRRVLDNQTRDIAIEARSLVNQHMTDCTSFRSDLKATLAEFRSDIKTLYVRLAAILGGLIMISKLVDFGVKLIH